VLLLAALGCGGGTIVATDAPAGDGGAADARGDSGTPGADAGEAGPPTDAAAADGAADAAAPCSTRITYGAAWIHGPGHPLQHDDADGDVTWDGTCTDEGGNSYATLSNGWKPYFTGHDACTISLDHTNCGGPAACATRVTYGSAWIPPANHPAQYDDVAGALLWDGTCRASGGSSFARLSNGWTPTFTGANACSLSFRYTECGALYENPVVDVDCPDPGVIRDGSRYVMACTSGGAANAFPIRVSEDLVSWTAAGHVFPSAQKPTWATGDFWAPEIHAVGGGFVAYFSARHTDGKLAVGAATSPSATGPFTDLGAPLLHDATTGLIDANMYAAPDGKAYLLWKEDGNAVGQPTPIHGQELAASGTSLVGSRATLITNDQAWEGPLVEGPWLTSHGGTYYLFYSGNAYYDGTYAVGVARASAPLGPYTKAGAPIVTTNAAWVGPGHNSVVDTPAGETWLVYHAWAAGHVAGPGDGRLVLVDRLDWVGGWPSLLAAPSRHSAPVP
jgi:GH43 family beta-xylosidase